jgi:hypothetical protein
MVADVPREQSRWSDALMTSDGSHPSIPRFLTVPRVTRVVWELRAGRWPGPALPLEGRWRASRARGTQRHLVVRRTRGRACEACLAFAELLQGNWEGRRPVSPRPHHGQGAVHVSSGRTGQRRPGRVPALAPGGRRA